MTIAIDVPGSDTLPPEVPNIAIEDPSPPLNIPPRPVDARECGITFALSNITLEAGRVLLTALHRNRRMRLQAQLAAELDRARIEEQRAEGQFERARIDHVVALERLRVRSTLEEKVRTLGQVIRRKRHEVEAQKIADELVRLEEERKASIERLGAERTERHEAEVAAWTQTAEQRKAQAQQLTQLREQLAESESDFRMSAAQRMNLWMTRTACGFLVWAGYTVIGATAIAVAALLDDGGRRNLLADIARSSIKLMDDFGRGSLHPMVAAPLSLLAFLGSLVALLVGIDLLMRWFDKRWLDPHPKAVAKGYAFPAKEELSRKTFSKLLIAIPVIYICGVIIAFTAYGDRVTTSTLVLGKNSAVMNAIIGSALCLLSASVFVLYFSNILEPRASTSGWRWRTRWEVGVVPFLMLAAIVLVAAFGPGSRWAWAGVTAFMLVGAMALAYGLLYRGMFRELDYAARAVVECDRRLAEVLEPPVKEEPSRAERHEIERVRSDYRARRQYLLDLDRERRLRRTFLTSDEHDPMLIAVYHVASSALWRVWVRLRRIGPQPDFYRVTDFEAAPVETDERLQCEQSIRQLEIELKAIDPDAALARRDARERELNSARQQRERAEREQSLTLAHNDEREAIEELDFESAFALGIYTKPAYDTITGRRNEVVRTAERPRVRRPARVRSEEVPSGH